MAKKVSELITEEEVLNWSKGDTITITAGTGAGKSYFVKNMVYDIAKRDNQKILMLVHRTNCKNQFEYELNKDGKSDIITVMTYQTIEYKELHNLEFDLSEYDYIFADEFHYFMSDASFNKTTDLSLQVILNNRQAIRVFMSATGNDVSDYLKDYKALNVKAYNLDINFNYIESLAFYYKDETLEYYMDQAINNKQKSIFFIQSAEKAYNLYKNYKEHSMFNCSKSNKLFKHVNKDKLQNLLMNERFNDLILITTTALDTGVNIIDEDLNHVLCDVSNPNTLIQCLGRKRIQHENDKLHVTIKSIPNTVIGGRLTTVRRNKQMTDFFYEGGIVKVMQSFPRQYDKSVVLYDTMKKGQLIKEVNELAYNKYANDEAIYKEMLANGEHGHMRYIVNLLNHTNYTVQESVQEAQCLSDYLESLVGKVMLKVIDRQEVIQTINIKQNGRLVKSLKAINSVLEEKRFKYQIKQFRTTRTIDGIKSEYSSAWRVEKITQ